MSAVKPGLSIFFPAYNDVGTIASLALVAHMTAREITPDHEVIVVEDGSPDHTAELLDVFSPEVDFVNGYKISRNDPLHRVIIGRLYHWFVKLVFGLRLRDVDCDFRLMRRSIFEKVRLTRSSGVICVELMKKVQDHGFRIAQVPVHHYHRSYGKSQFFNFARVGRTLVDLTRLWFELVPGRQHLRPGTPHSTTGSSPLAEEATAEGAERP